MAIFEPLFPNATVEYKYPSGQDRGERDQSSTSGMAMMVNREAPLGGLSSLMAMKGRMGDTELVHMSKPEVRSLQALGQLSVNPSTGLPEAFKLKDALPVLAGIAGSVFLPGIGSALGTSLFSGISGGALAGAVGTGIGSLLAGQSADKALFNAALSFGTGALLGNITAGADPTMLKGGEAAGFSAPLTAADIGDTLTAGQLQGAKDIGLYSQNFTPPQVGDVASNVGFTTKPNLFERELLGQTPQTVQAGEYMSPSKAYELTGGRYGVPTSSQVLSKPSTYGPALGALLVGPEQEPYQPPSRTALEPRRQTLSGGETIAPVATEESALDIALGRSPARNYLSPYTYAKAGGLIRLNEGGMPMEEEDVEEGSPEYFEGRVDGNGDGMSDEVEFEVEGEDPDMAMLSRDEYVLPADVVAIIGNGSSEAGADKIDMFVKQARKKAFGTEKQQKQTKGDGGLASLVA